MVEVARLDHLHDVGYIDGLVHVRRMAESPGQAREAQGRGQNHERGQGHARASRARFSVVTGSSCSGHGHG